jgi:hypothetical protein
VSCRIADQYEWQNAKGNRTLWSHKLLRNERIEFNELTILNTTSAPPFNEFNLMAALVSTLAVAYRTAKQRQLWSASSPRTWLRLRRETRVLHVLRCAYADTTKPESSQLRSLAEGPTASICFNQPFVPSDELAA